MIYILYNNREEIEGEFSTITDLELYVDTVRELRNERYPNTPSESLEKIHVKFLTPW